MPPRSERFKPLRESSELAPRESLKEQFSKIISVHVDADNVDSFLEKALNQLILYTHAVTLAYQEELESKDTSVNKVQEDAALAHYSLPAIEEYFEGIEKRQKIIAEAQALIDAIQADETVNTPPDRGKSIRTGNGHGTFENPATQKRLMLLLYLLKVDFDITLNQSDMQKGIVTRNMLRSESYVTVSISEKDRIVYICDEIGNATYVFDTHKLSEINLTIEQLNNLTKDEKNTLIAENPGIGIRTTYNKYYRETLTSLLGETIPSPEAFKEATKSKPELQKETSDAPQVITEELHPWRGFLEKENEDGVVEHWGPVSSIARKIKLSGPTIRSSVNGLFLMKGKDMRNAEVNLYSLEQVQEKLRDYLALPQVSLEGEWKGFLEKKNEEGVVEHFGAIRNIAQKMNLSDNKIVSSVNGLLALQGKDVKNGEVSLYSIEQVEERLKDHLALPQVDKNGEWEGFLEHIDIETGIVEHFGAIRTIARRMNLSQNKIIPSVEGLLALQGMTVGGISTELYSIEQVEERLKDHLALPQVDKNGEWEGFLEHIDIETGIVEHFGTISNVAQRMKVSNDKIKSFAEELPFLNGKDVAGHEVNLYSLEQVQEKFREYLALPQVSLEGEWKGFLERVNEDTRTVEHFGSIRNIAQKMNLSEDKIASSVKRLLALQGKDMRNAEVNLYSLEQVQEKLRDYLALPQVSLEGEWKGFLEKKNEEGVVEHFGAIRNIAQRMKINRPKMESVAKNLSSAKGKDMVGKEADLYSLEQIQAKLRDFLALPQVDKEGEWKGFLERINEDTQTIEHYGAITIIAQKMNLSDNKIVSSVTNLPSLKGKDIRGAEAQLYSLEQIQAKLKDYFALLQVAAEGEWKGFLEQTNKEGVIENYGSVATIAQRLNISEDKVKTFIKDSPSLKGKGANGVETDLYSFERVAQKLGK